MEKHVPPTGDDSSEKMDPESFVPDTQKIVHRHLQDPNHQITEEEMKSVKISTEHFDQEYKDSLDDAVVPKEGDEKSGTDDKIITPWDVTT